MKEDKDKTLSKELAKGMKTELTARMIMSQPNDEYKKGFNEAMKWASRMVDRYEKGNGLFQQ